MIDIQINRLPNDTHRSMAKSYCEKIVVKIFGIKVFVKVIIPVAFD